MSPNETSSVGLASNVSTPGVQVRLVRLDALVTFRAGQRRAIRLHHPFPLTAWSKREQTRGGAHRWLTFKSRANKKKKEKNLRENAFIFYLHDLTEGGFFLRGFENLDTGQLSASQIRPHVVYNARLAVVSSWSSDFSILLSFFLWK